MLRLLVKYYSRRFLSSWAVLVYDIVVVICSFIVAYFVRFNFDYTNIDSLAISLHLVKSTTVYFFFFIVIRSYSGIIRHTALSDAIRVLKATGFSFSLLVLLNIGLSLGSAQGFYIIPFSVLILHFLLSVFILVGSRVVVKWLFLQTERQYIKEKIPVVIYGAGSAGMLAKNALIKDVVHRYIVVAYIDDNPSKVNKSLEGIPVITSQKGFQESYIEQHKIKQLIIAIQDIHPEKKKEIIDVGLELSLQVKVVPAINLWINGQLSSKQLRQVEIEELLGRETIQLDSKNIDRELKNKIVLVTGGAGSIGSEIARQILRYAPKRLIILDQAETPIYDLQFEFNNAKNSLEYCKIIEFVIADVKDSFQLNNIFNLYRPDIIYHAAAYKHVPLMEQSPYEALRVNTFGTKILADLSVKYEVQKFVFISSDKAVNPSNIMGASKRIAEIYIQSLSNKKTKFVTTRFGNVLGSNGSVVPLFRKQIQSGGPITITHKEITRFFMTIPEACNLVLEAGAMGDGFDIFIFDMGEPVKIYDIAKKMLRLYGYSDNEVRIEEIGLRPGEKLYEELLNINEATLPTHHPKIMKAKISPICGNKISRYFNELSDLIIAGDDFALVDKMKQIVPEFKSRNSVYEKLDRQIKK